MPKHLDDSDTVNGNGYGRDLEGNPTNRNPDCLIGEDEHVFDIYTPKPGTASRGVINNIRRKLPTQAQRVVINLSFFSGDIESLKADLLRATGPLGNLKHLKELLVVYKDGTVESWFVR